jgi:hypothetical protein
MTGMTPPPQHREHLADRVQRLESFAFISGGGLADIKGGGQLFHAALATRQDLQAMEQRLNNRLSGLESRLDRVLAAVGRADGQPHP